MSTADEIFAVAAPQPALVTESGVNPPMTPPASTPAPMPEVGSPTSPGAYVNVRIRGLEEAPMAAGVGTEAPGAAPPVSIAEQMWNSEAPASMDPDFVKALTATPEGDDPIARYGTLGKVLDLLSRPENASANVAQYLHDEVNKREGSINPAEVGVESALFGKAPVYAAATLERVRREDIDHILDLAWRGLKGDKKQTYDELTRQWYPEMNPWKRAALSLTMAIALDPSNVIPIGTGVKLAGKGVKAIPGVKAVGKALEETALGKAFIPGAGTPTEWRVFKADQRAALEAEKNDILSWAADFRAGMTKEEREALTYYREHPGTTPVYPRNQAKLKMLGDKLDGLIESAHADGLISDVQYTAWKAREGSYMPHIYLTPEGAPLSWLPDWATRNKYRTRFLKGTMPPQWAQTKPFFMKQRKIETIDDALNLSQGFKEMSQAKDATEFAATAARYPDIDTVAAFKAVDPNDFDLIRKQAAAYSKYLTPVTDSAEAVTLRALDQAVYKARKNFVDETVAQFGKKVPHDTKVVPEGYGLYFPKGHLRFYPAEVIDKRFRNELEQAADALHNLRMRTERTTRTVTETTTTGPQAAASDTMSRSAQVWEGRVREAMTARGFSVGEADIAITKLKTEGKAGVGEVVDSMVTRVEEVVNRTLDSSRIEGDLVHISSLDELTKVIPSITKKVPVYMMDEAIVKDLNRASRMFAGDEASNAFLRWFDRATNTWKLYATSVRLPFHLRNWYSNMWQSWLAGVNNPERYLDAARLQKDLLTKSFDKTWPLGGKDYTVRELKSLLDKHGVSGRGWIGSDVAVDAVQELDAILRFGKLRHATLPRVGRAIGTAIEDNSRLAVFMDQLMKGAEPREAAATVRKFLFDYQDLTDFERNVMRRALPFYTWSRKNGPLQLEGLVTQPRKYQTYGKALRAAGEPETAEEQMLRPDYFDQLVYRKSWMQTPQGKPIYMALDLPPLEFNRLTSPTSMAAGIHPFKALVETAMNRKIFPQMSELAKTPLEMEPAPIWLQWLNNDDLKKLSDAKLIGPMLNKRGYFPDASGKAPQYVLGVNKRLLHTINSFVPMLNEVGRTYAQPLSLTDERPETWKQSYLTGISQKALDTQVESEAFSYELLGAQESLTHFIGQRGRMPSEAEFKQLVPGERVRNILKLNLKP